MFADRTVTINGVAIPLDPRRIVAAVVADVRSMPRPLLVWFGFLGGLLALGGLAALIALPPGWEVLGTSPSVEWGLLIVGYVVFAITTSGLCLASSLGTVFGIDRYRPLEKRHAILAVLFLTAAFGIIALDLHFPVRMVFGAVFSPAPTSPMWWMGVVYAGYYVILLVEVWSIFWNRPVIHQWACTLAAATAVVAPLTLGAVFGVLNTKAWWNGPFTPLLMIASAFVAGVSLLSIVFFFVIRFRRSGFERGERLAVPGLRWLLGIGLVVVALLVARAVVAVLVGDHRGGPGTIEAILAGPLSAPFWGLRVFVGLVLPLALIAMPATRTTAGLFAAAVCALIGVVVDRWILVIGGQIAPYTSASGVTHDVYAEYAPSPVEIAIVVGAAAFVAFGYTLAERYLDLRESDVHVGLRIGPMIERFRERVGRRSAPMAPPVVPPPVVPPGSP